MMGHADLGFGLTLVTMCLWGSIGTLAKLSRVKWVVFFLWYSCGVAVAAFGLAWYHNFKETWVSLTDANSVEMACGFLGGFCGCVGSMLFMSSIQLIGVTICYPLVMGLEMTVGTILLVVVSPVEAPGLLFGACVCMLGALALDVLAQLQLSVDTAAAAAEPPPSPLAQQGEATTLLTKKEANPLAKPSLPPRNKSNSSLGKHDFVTIPLSDDDEPSPSMLRTRSMEFLAESDLIVTVQPAEIPAAAPASSSSWAPDVASRMGIARGMVGGVLLAIWPALEAIAVDSRGENVAVFLVTYAIGHVLAFVVAAPVRTLYLLRPASMSSTKLQARRGALILLDTSPRAITFGVLAGILWFLGAVACFSAGTLVGVTVAVSVGRCSPVIAVLWGIFFWREAQHASLRAALYIGLALFLYVATIILVAFSSRAARQVAADAT